MSGESATGQDAGRLVGGRYRLMRMLGRGGMGAVWQAEDTLLARQVALKEVWLPSAGDGPIEPSDPVVQRVIREARAAARLRHPGIVAIHDVIEDDGRPWIVMELVDGRSLADVISQQGLLSERQAAEVGLQVLESLRSAHRAGVAHRDVKPANILVAEDRVVLTDFGIATIYDATALTATGQMVGSPAYVSPERINGLPATAAADLWALGVTLYCAVTGESPFQRDSTSATLMAVLKHRPVAPPHSGRLWPLIKGLLEKDPAHRLNVEQSRLLLQNVIRILDESERENPVSRSRGRLPFLRRQTGDPIGDGLPPTAHAPAPTLAAATVPDVGQQAIGDETIISGQGDASHPWTVDIPSPGPAPLPAFPEPSRRRWKPVLSVAVAVSLVLALAGFLMNFYGYGRNPIGLDVSASPAVAGFGGKLPLATAGSGQTASSSPDTQSPAAASMTPTTVDTCVVGVWRSTRLSKRLKIRTAVFSFTGGSGVIKRVWPDGRSSDDYTRAAPLTVTDGTKEYAETIRGTRTQQTSTDNGALTIDGIVSQLTVEITENGKQLPVTMYPRQSETYPYTCTPNDLALNDGTTFEIYQRIGADPDMPTPGT